MRELDKVLDSNEKVLWEGKPSFLPFLFGNSFVSTIFGLVWMGFVLLIVVMSFRGPGNPFNYFIFLLPHFWVGVAVLFGPIIYSSLVFKKTYYAITDKRVIIQTGWIGRDFQMVDFDQVTNAEVNVGVADKLLGGGTTGSILISSAGSFTYTPRGGFPTPYTLSNILNPYEVFKLFKRVALDVKTDIEYPNKLRPSDNPGYQTAYEPDIKD